MANPSNYQRDQLYLLLPRRRIMKWYEEDSQKGRSMKKKPEGKLWINVDASFRPESGNGGTCAVIRD